MTKNGVLGFRTFWKCVTRSVHTSIHANTYIYIYVCVEFGVGVVPIPKYGRNR